MKCAEQVLEDYSIKELRVIGYITSIREKDGVLLADITCRGKLRVFYIPKNSGWDKEFYQGRAVCVRLETVCTNGIERHRLLCLEWAQIGRKNEKRN